MSEALAECKVDAVVAEVVCRYPVGLVTSTNTLTEAILPGDGLRDGEGDWEFGVSGDWYTDEEDDPLSLSIVDILCTNECRFLFVLNDRIVVQN